MMWVEVKLLRKEEREEEEEKWVAAAYKDMIRPR